MKRCSIGYIQKLMTHDTEKSGVEGTIILGSGSSKLTRLKYGLIMRGLVCCGVVVLVGVSIRCFVTYIDFGHSWCWKDLHEVLFMMRVSRSCN